MTQKTKRGDATAYFAKMVASRPWPGECILWPYAKNAAGYGVFGKKRGQVQSCIVARVACEVAHGLPPHPSHEAAHICGNGHKGCVNPAHVRWRTSKDNKADQLAHGTRNSGERNGQAKLSPDTVRQIQDMCRTRLQKEVAQEFSIDPSTVSLIARGKLWGHLCPKQ